MSTAVQQEPDPRQTDDTPPLRVPLRSEDILHNTRAVLDVVGQEAAESERIGRLTPRLEDALRRAGVFQMAFPARRGGPEMSLADQTTVVELVATVDAGVAWNVGVLAATGFYAGRLSDAAYAELYPHRDLPTAGCFWPRGRAEVVEGGYLVSGSWATGSGMLSADYVLGGCEVFDDGVPVIGADGEPRVIGAWLKPVEVEIYHDWDVIGLRSSGSTGYGVQDKFVPASHSFDRYFEPGTYPDPLESAPQLISFSMSGIPVGIAQHAVDFAVDRVRAMIRRGVTPTDRVLALIGEAVSHVRAARAAVMDGVTQLDRIIFSGGVPDAYALARGDGPVATEAAHRAIQILADIVGSRFVYNKDGYERLARDIMGVTVHGTTGKRAMWIDVGRAVVEREEPHVPDATGRG